MNALTEAITCYPPLIEDVALAIADDAYPNLSRMRYHGMLDEFAQPLVGPVRAAYSPEDKLAAMKAHLCDELGFTGNRNDYYDPRNSFLNEVLERRTGIPISLAAVWMAVGRRAGVLVEGVGFPGHFLVRVGGKNGPFADVFNDGRPVDDHDLRRLGARFNLSPEQRSLALSPIDARAMAYRMLLNLRAIYASRGEHARAMLVSDRLFDLTADAVHRRDRGMHAMQLGANEAAMRDFEAYLAANPEAEDAKHIRSLLEGTMSAGRALN